MREAAAAVTADTSGAATVSHQQAEVCAGRAYLEIADERVALSLIVVGANRLDQMPGRRRVTADAPDIGSDRRRYNAHGLMLLQ